MKFAKQKWSIEEVNGERPINRRRLLSIWFGFWKWS